MFSFDPIFARPAFAAAAWRTHAAVALRDLDPATPEAEVRERLAKAFAEYMDRGWAVLTAHRHAAVAGVVEETLRDRITASAQSFYKEIARLWAGVPRRTGLATQTLGARVPALTAVAGEALVASRLTGADEEEVAPSLRLAAEGVATAFWIARLDDLIHAHGLPDDAAAIGALAAIDLSMGGAAPGKSIKVGSFELKVEAPETFIAQAALAARDDGLSVAREFETYRVFSERAAAFTAAASNLPDVDLEPYFRLAGAARSQPSQEAAREIIHALVRATLARSGEDLVAADHARRVATVLPGALEAFAAFMAEASGAHARLERIRRYCIEEMDRRRRADPDVVVAVGDLIDEMHEFAIVVQDLVRHGYPPGIVLSHLNAWRALPLGPTERDYLEKISLFAAWEYARRPSTDEDPGFRSLADSSPLRVSEVRELCRGIQGNLYPVAALDDVEMTRRAAASLKRAMEQGRISPREHAALADEPFLMVAKVRAYEEARLLSVLRAVAGRIPTDVLKSTSLLPYTAHVAIWTPDRLALHRLPSSLGPSAREPWEAAIEHMVEYRRGARSSKEDVKPIAAEGPRLRDEAKILGHRPHTAAKSKREGEKDDPLAVLGLVRPKQGFGPKPPGGGLKGP